MVKSPCAECSKHKNEFPACRRKCILINEVQSFHMNMKTEPVYADYDSSEAFTVGYR